jgi:hypothetical protein
MTFRCGLPASLVDLKVAQELANDASEVASGFVGR